jgi:hypothetical protein
MMVTGAMKDAVVEYFDNEDQLGRDVDVSEIQDVLRALEGAPKEEEAIFDLARDVTIALMQDGVIVAYGIKDHPTDMRFRLAPREEA